VLPSIVSRWLGSAVIGMSGGKRYTPAVPSRKGDAPQGVAVSRNVAFGSIYTDLNPLPIVGRGMIQLADSLSAALCPAHPEGYQAVAPFDYPKVRLQIAALAALVVTPLVLQRLVAWMCHRGVVQLMCIDRASDMATVIVSALLTLVAHELLHAAAYRAYGYQVTYGVSLHPLAAYVVALNQWHRRNRSIVTALTPVVALTLVCVPLLALCDCVAILVGSTALAMNASAAVGDLYLAWRLVRMPQSTLFYPVDTDTMLVYVLDA
jgi:hypothetical protein